MDDGAGGQEQQRFEKGMRHQVKDPGAKSADSASQEHVAELADGGVGQDALDVGLHQADGGGEQGGGTADDRDNQQRGFRVLEENMRTRDDVNARRDHGGGVNQCAHRRRAFHGVRQPDIERKLCGFTGGAHEQEQGSDGEGAEYAPGFVRPLLLRNCGEKGVEVQGLESPEEQEHSQHEPEVAYAVDDEGFLARVRSGLFKKIETDEQVAGEADPLPSDKKQHVVGGQHQNEHEEHEQVQVAEEAVVAALRSEEHTSEL